MRQIVQSIQDGSLSVAFVPDPVVRPGHVLIANAASVISAGTEKMVMELARKSLLGKARERPDQVRRVIEKMRNEGLLSTVGQVRARLDEPLPMGYSSAGVVLATGAGVQGLQPWDRVASNGNHAGVVSVPRHLCARVPDGVEFEHAAFAVLGAIAMQGVRLARVSLGETVFVVGLGLIGQITVALLKAAGCRVLGTDLDPSKCELALRMGCDEAEAGMGAGAVEARTGGLGADAVLIAASTSSSGPIELAGEAVRAKGRVVVVGAVGMEVPRRPYYFKEAELVVSCSYGPGRYDPEYEDRGHDYPPAHVRWTEQRNLGAVLALMGAGKLDVAPLISHRFAIEDGEQAYALIDRGDEPYLAIVLTYPDVAPAAMRRRITLRGPGVSGRIGVGCLGAGSFARTVLLPALRKESRLRLRSVCAPGGLSAAHTGDRLGFELVTTDEDELLDDPEVQVVFVITRHDQHARLVERALRAGKHVFVEKPLALTVDELAGIEAALRDAGDAAPLLMVGFNRRFAPATAHVAEAFAGVRAPRTASFRFNAGAVPADHWTQDLAEGGGRIIGEACHGIDLVTHLVGAPVTRVYASSIGGSDAPAITDDQAFLTLNHANGAVSSVAYLAGGDKAFPKERAEVVGGGRVAVLDDFRSVTTVAGGKTRRRRWMGQDKGHAAEIQAFARALVERDPAPIPWDELRATSLAAILAVRSLREGIPFEVR